MATGPNVERSRLKMAEQGSAPSAPPSGFGYIYAKADGLYFMGDDGMEIGPLGEAGGGSGFTGAAAKYIRSAGNYTTTSGTFVDVDATAGHMSLTITTGAKRVMVGFVGAILNSAAGNKTTLDVDLDGSRLSGPADGGLLAVRHGDASYRDNGSFTFLTDVLGAGSHTFKLQWMTNGGTSTIEGATASSDNVATFWVQELA